MLHLKKEVVQTQILKRQEWREGQGNILTDKDDQMRTLLLRLNASTEFGQRTKDDNDNLVIEVALVLVTVSVYGTEESPTPASNIL